MEEENGFRELFRAFLKRRWSIVTIISLLIIVSLAVAPILRGLYRQEDFFLISICVLGCSLIFINLKGKQLQFDFIDGLCLLLCFSYLLSLSNAVNLREAYLGVVKSVTYFSLYYLVRQCFRKREEKAVILKVIIFSLMTGALLTILTRIGIIQFPGAIDYNRLAGTLQYPNTFAAAMMLAISLTYYLDLSAERRQRPIYLIINYLNTVAFLSSASRGAFIIYLPLMIFYLIHWRNKGRFFVRLSLVNIGALVTSIFMFRLAGWQLSAVIALVAIGIYVLDKIAANISGRKQVFITIGVIFLGGVIGLFLVPNTVLWRLTELNLSSKASIARLIFYWDALKIFQTSPLIGHGADSWEYLYRAIQTYYYNTKFVHSNLFQLLVDVGLLGVITYYSLFLVVGLRNIKAFFSREKQLEAVVLITLIAAQLHALIDLDFSIPAMVVIVFVLLGLLAGTYEKGIINPRIIRVPLIVLTTLSLLSVVSLLVGGIGVERAIAEVKNGEIQVNNIVENRNKFSIATSFDPLNSYYRDYLGQYLIAEGLEKGDQGIMLEGIKELDKAIKLSPCDYNLYADKGRMLAQFKLYEESNKNYKKIIELMPYHQKGYEYLSRAYTTQAIEENDPSYAEKTLEVYQLAEGNYNKIPKQYIEMILAENQLTNSAMLNYQMGLACFFLEKYEEGINHFQVALKYLSEENVAEEIKSLIAVGTKRISTDATAINANSDMVAAEK